MGLEVFDSMGLKNIRWYDSYNYGDECKENNLPVTTY
jgi:hypothetical protein